MNTNKTTVQKDFDQNSIKVSRTFDAHETMVWRCYSESHLLDQWWGPAPWKAETKIMKFEEGGHWLYAMVSPEGEKHWGIMKYLIIKPLQFIILEDAFCDENGILNSELPLSAGKMVFEEMNESTVVDFIMTYSSPEQLKVIIEMGFEEGITKCLDQLEELLTKQI